MCNIFNFSNKGEIKSFVKLFTGSVGCLYMQPTITLVDFKHRISVKAKISSVKLSSWLIS